MRAQFVHSRASYLFTFVRAQFIEESGTVQSGATAICAANLTIEGSISSNDFGCDPQQVRFGAVLLLLLL